MHKSMIGKLGIAPSGCALAMMLSTHTWAQGAAEQDVLDTVVVTAQRREENLQKVGVAVSAVGGDALVQAGVSDVANLTKLVPALVVQPNGGSSMNFYLRGVGSYATNAFAENAVAFNFAGVYVARPTSPIGTFFDLERIEVVKGPQGTLYGRNATGGAINVIPNAAKLGEFSGNVMAELGSYSAKKGAAAINVPLGSAAALRVAAQVVDRDGYLSEGYDDEEGEAVRVSFKFAPSDDLSIDVVGDYFHQGGRGIGSVMVGNPVLTPTAPPVEDRAAGSDPRSLAELARRFPAQINSGAVVGPKSDGFQDSTFYGISATVQWAVGAGDLTFIPAYRYGKPDFLSYNLGFLMDLSEKDEQSSLEVRYASNADAAFRYLVGGYFFKEEQEASNYFEQGLASRTTFRPELETKSNALFGQATFDLTNRARLIGGVRYTDESKSSRTPIRQQSIANPNPPFVNTVGDLDFESTTWKAGVEFDVRPDSLLYANVATGFKAGGFFVAVRNNTFEPEELTAFTLGSKNRFLDNRLQLNAEVFYWDYQDQQIGFVGPVEITLGNFTPAGKTVNAGDVTIYGTEVELEYLLTSADRVNANVQYLHSEYDRFLYTAISGSGAVPTNACVVTPNTSLPVTAPARLFDINCAGKAAINAPEWTVNLGYEHEFALGNNMELVAGLRTRIETSRTLSIEYLPESEQDDYMMSDVYLTLNGPEAKWSVTGFVNNVEDEEVYASSSLRPFLPVVYNALRPPRTYGVRGAFKF